MTQIPPKNILATGWFQADNWLLYAVLVVILIYFYWDELFEPLRGKFHQRKLPRIAEQLGLDYKYYGYEGGTVLTGNYRSIPVRLYEDLRGLKRYGGIRFRKSLWFTEGPLARNERRHAIYEIKLDRAAVPDELYIFPENLTAKLGKLIHREDIQIGIPEIDQAFIIQGTFTEDAQKFFARPGVVRHFLELRALCKNFRLENSCLIFEFRYGIAIQHDKLRTQLETLTRCAHAIQQTDPFTQSTSQPAPHALKTAAPYPEPIPLPDTFEPNYTPPTRHPQPPPDGHW